MSLAALSIRRPVLVACVFFLILALGALSYARLPTSLYPDVSFPIVNIMVPFPGAGPEEIEAQIAKPLENALSGLEGVRSIRSTNIQGAGIVTTVFTLGTDVRFAEQRVAQALARVRGTFPSGYLEPSLRSIDPSDVPLLTLALTAELPQGELFELAQSQVRPRLERVPGTGLVQIQGARKREVHVELDRNRLVALEMTAGEVVNAVGQGGMNIPAGQVSGPERDTLISSSGRFETLDAIRKIPIRFIGNEAITTLDEVAGVKEGLSDEQTRAYVAGRRALLLQIYRQRGKDTLRLAQNLREHAKEIERDLKPKLKGFDLAVVHDGAKPIRDSVREAKLAIQIGVVLTILVVFFFLGNLRSTLITGVALPNSLLGAFLLMWLAGFSVNITTLAALSLAVGLLIDDAIVVRESIFRRIENGEPANEAAVKGTDSVALAVVATTLTVLSVFGPIAFLRGIIGQFFKQFGLTLCFAMLISLLDSLTVAPMLSARFAGQKHDARGPPQKPSSIGAFARFQRYQESVYSRTLRTTLRHPWIVLAFAGLVFALSFFAYKRVPKIFIPPAGTGEFQVLLKSVPGTSLQGMDEIAQKVDRKIRSHLEVERTLLSVGGENGENHQARVLVLLKESRDRTITTEEMKTRIRADLPDSSEAIGSVQDILDIGGGAGQPFVVNVTGQDLEELKTASNLLVQHLRQKTDLKDITSSYEAGATEVRAKLDPVRAQALGVTSAGVGQELRLLLAGAAPARFHDKGEQYDIRVRLREDQRDLARDYEKIRVPNLNHRLIPLSSVTHRIDADSPSSIRRENRKRFIEVSADVDPKGRGLGHAIEVTRAFFDSGKHHLPSSTGYEFAGQTRDFQDLLSSALLAIGISIGFMYLVLAALYESFVIPFAILLVLPLAVCGAFYALAATGTPLEINSMIGCILLLGVSAKNSILLVDRIQEELRSGRHIHEAILTAGKLRLRPILMTTFALIAGMLPVAIPLEEAARQRAGMAIAVIGGLVSSTLLTLVVIPAAYECLARMRTSFVRGRLK